MLEPPKRGVLTRNRIGVVWVDLDDVAEAVWLCRVIRLRGVETWIDGLPTVDARPVFQPVAAVAERSWVGDKVAVEVFLT
jgi:hypothetical protein